MAKSTSAVDDRSTDAPKRRTTKKKADATPDAPAKPARSSKAAVEKAVEVKAEPKPAAKPEPRPEPRAESRPEPRADARSEQAAPRNDSRPSSPAPSQGNQPRSFHGPNQPSANRPSQGSNPMQQTQQAPSNQHQSQSHSGGGGGGGGQQGQGQQGGMNALNKRRKKKKKKKGGGMGGGPSGGGANPAFVSYGPISSNQLPNEEELAREAAELEKIVGTKEYKEAEKEALNLHELRRMKIADLHKVADKEGLSDYHQTPRQELIFQILKARGSKGGIMFGEGTLDIAPEGYGFLRSAEQSYLAGPDDIFVAPSQIRQLGLKRGMEIRGAIRGPKENEKFFALLRVDSVNNKDPKTLASMTTFEDLTPLHPEERIVLETEPGIIETRIIDMVAPIGKGQRGLIVAPPRTGKTVLLQKMTQAIKKNYPDIRVIVLLIDERPEEVTDFKRNTDPSVEVIASTFDEQPRRHVQVAEMVIEKARRAVEFGEHVVILLDSITRLARAYNNEMPHSGKIMSGGIDSGALQRPKKFFGSARAIEGGGSLTILATALVDTGSKADEVIFEEFKGTGNSELHLDRKLVDKRVWPAIDIAASGTRREELLLDPKELELVYRLRKVLADMNVVEAMELMKSRLGKVKTNAEFLMTMAMGG